MTQLLIILFAILVRNGIIYSLTFFHLNNKNSSENISVIRNNSEKNGLVVTSLIASNPIRLTSSETNTSQTLNGTSLETSTSQTLSASSLETSTSQTLSVTSLETSTSQTLSVTSSETNVSQDIFDDLNWIDERISEAISSETNTSQDMLNNENWIEEVINEGMLPYTTSLDSLTVLDSQTFAQWREMAMDLHEYPINSPAILLQQTKLEELNILYSQDIIHYGISQTELRLIIEHFPATSLFNPDINHLILTVMSYYHT
jgi:hypothetical protein